MASGETNEIEQRLRNFARATSMVAPSDGHPNRSQWLSLSPLGVEQPTRQSNMSEWLSLSSTADQQQRRDTKVFGIDLQSLTTSCSRSTDPIILQDDDYAPTIRVPGPEVVHQIPNAPNAQRTNLEKNEAIVRNAILEALSNLQNQVNFPEQEVPNVNFPETPALGNEYVENPIFAGAQMHGENPTGAVEFNYPEIVSIGELMEATNIEDSVPPAIADAVAFILIRAPQLQSRVERIVQGFMDGRMNLELTMHVLDYLRCYTILQGNNTDNVEDGEEEEAEHEAEEEEDGEGNNNADIDS